jgi:ubiquitin carboxyl-terminal hydrolase 5/13
MISYDGKPIDKDQCFYCFQTLFDGLFVFPHAHRAFCATHLPWHQHFQPRDVDYVHIRKIAKVQQEPPAKLIKLEIKEQSESELYDIETKLYHEGNIVSPTPEDTISIDRIVNSDSLAKKEELKTWTQEFAPCEHTIEFQQIPTLEIQLEKCHDCELDQNLWICLTCGQLGCGRAQFGGVPGNTHALQHYESTGHPIAVKLGSLSRDVTDVYCYQCSDEILFPGLQEKLKTFGIDLDNFKKTEKSLVELQIEQNMKWEFNMVNDQGGQLPPVFGPELTGLKNLGNSCYLSSVAQSLFSLPEYKQLAEVPLESLNEQDGLQFQLIKLAKGLISGDFSKPNADGCQVGIIPTSFKNLIGANHEEFSSMRQQDAFEFWNYLLDKVDALDPHLNDIFRFVTVEKFKVGDDREVLLKKQVTENLTLPVNIELDHVDEDGTKHYKPQDFIDSLIQSLSPEEIEWKGGKAIRTTFIKSFPKYLVTAIQRIQLEKCVPVKTDVPLSLPESFNIADFQPDELLEENEVEKAEEDEDFSPNLEAFNQLLQMGFPENRCKKALYSTGNSSMEVAMNWLFEHMDDPTIDEPLVVKKNHSQVDEEKMQSLMDMGFSHKLALKALVLNNQDANTAVEWLFSNPDDDGELPQASSANKSVDSFLAKETSSEYSLKAVICHKGTQVTSGHYVAFIKKGDRWILFNDEKVVDVTGDARSWQELEKNGYVYLWERS